VQLVHALTAGGPLEEHVVNVVNNGTMPLLPDDAVIEVSSIVDYSGATPLPVRPVEPLYAGLIAQVTAYENLALEAAVRGGDGTAGEPPVRGAHVGVSGRTGLSPGGRDLLRGRGR
jgi:alpha-galactosidase/6-phospho-beta-glucosidase family protein